MSLFDSFRISRNIIKNRILAPPFSDNQAEINGRVSQTQYNHFLRLAKQGAGTVVIDAAYVCQQGRGSSMQLGISEEDHTPGIKVLVKLLKELGVFTGIRLSHAGAKTNHKLCGETPIGPSVIHFGKEYEPSRPFDEHDIKEVCTFFGHAAERAEEIGLDFIEIDCCRNNLFEQCINPQLNTRDDQYGGNVKNRMKFLIETINFIKKRIGKQLMISVFVGNPLDRMEEAEGLEELRDILKIINKEKIDFIHMLLNHSNQLLSNNEYLLEFIGRNAKLPIIIEGSIKSNAVLKELIKLDRSTFYCLDKSLFQKQNWYQLLHKKK